MDKVSPKNRLNELSAQEWLRFTKTWFIHNPPPRKKKEILHPAKYPEDLIAEFIRFFTKPGETVFDPFLGTGSTLVACHNTGRPGVGIELQQKYGKIAQERISKLEEQKTLIKRIKAKQKVLIGDSGKFAEIWRENKLGEIDLVITSPPYGPMLKKKGLVAKERAEKGLDTEYSEDEEDLGNAQTYREFLKKLVEIFLKIKPKIKVGGYLVIILQNYMDKGEYKMLAWDFAREMANHFQLRGEKVWCQDNKTLYPYGYRYSFVPNVHHHYCLIFKNIEGVS